MFFLTAVSFIRVSVGVDFQEELSDMLLLKMLQAATRASADKDKVRAFTLHTQTFRFVHLCISNPVGTQRIQDTTNKSGANL